MNIIIGDGSDKFVSIVECPKEICENFYTYLSTFIDSDMYRHTWGIEELVSYINKTKPSHLKDLKIVNPYTDEYDEGCPRFNI